MTNEQAINIIVSCEGIIWNRLTYDEKVALDKAIKALQQGYEKVVESCDDLISRQAAIDALGNGALVNYQAAGHLNGLVKAIDVIKGLPSAQPEQVEVINNYYYTIEQPEGK